MIRNQFSCLIRLFRCQLNAYQRMTSKNSPLLSLGKKNSSAFGLSIVFYSDLLEKIQHFELSTMKIIKNQSPWEWANYSWISTLKYKENNKCENELKFDFLSAYSTRIWS